MNSRLNYSEVLATLGGLFPSADFKSYLNQACEVFINSGKWKGAITNVSYPDGTTTGYITLGRRYLSALGYVIGYAPRPIHSQNHEFQELGYGYRVPNQILTDGMIDMGDSYCTQRDIETEGTLKFVIADATDANKKVRVFGTYKDTDGIIKERYSSDGSLGIEVTLANPSVSTTETFLSVTDISISQTSLTKGYIKLYVTNGGTDTLLSTYEPGETAPQYRRYKMGVTSGPIVIQCQRRYIPVVNNTDWVHPGNMQALKGGMQAIQSEEAKNYDQAKVFWDRAYALLDQELGQFRGKITPIIPYTGKGNPPPIRFVR